MFTYKGPAEKTNVREHRPDDCCKVWDIQESRAVPFYEKGDYWVPKKVENYKTKVVEDYSGCVAWGGISKRSILFEYYEGLKSCENTTEKSKEAEIIVDIGGLFY